ncbi:GNAT family N-acetyltransferase [Psychrobium sp. MM17-31]|uniref:GNAT family N-acetyltransferase n=1 Tax=Psychrobium sp. MM17-31 TaxID=2917758 RepID=UPI001EF713D5|nr:GNAT family N-acetyltransferase [Psychrobium sp. MM17-31]MCG7529803.1 GNAT family N-acetyltransferase [Psychrobium sp. MM17-31]
MIEIIKTTDLKAAAQFTLDNMQVYYQMYDVDWQLDDVYQATKALDNYDILVDGKRVGVLRLSFDDNTCQLRDIQIGSAHQSKGYGAQVIELVKNMAKEQDCSTIELKVFQRSAAHKLYSRVGFTVDKEDEKFYYMSLTL